MHLRWVRVLIMLLVGINLTVVCQGHDVGAAHSGLHISFLAQHHPEDPAGDTAVRPDSAELASKETAHSHSHTLINTHAHEHMPSHTQLHSNHQAVSGAGGSASAPTAPQGPAKTGLIGPSSDTPVEGTGLFTISVLIDTLLAGPDTRFNKLDPARIFVWQTQISSPPDPPPPQQES